MKFIKWRFRLQLLNVIIPIHFAAHDKGEQAPPVLNVFLYFIMM